ncbi:MAG: DUF3604 domain-containing protein [Myxococcaceae bacterium]
MKGLTNCIVIMASATLLNATTSVAQEAASSKAAPAKPTNQYSPYVDQTFPDRVLWGCTHIHTALSADAGLMGVTLGPADMFRFTRGEVVTINTGLKVRLDRPLDWLAITDHAEYMGLADQIRSSSPALLGTPMGKQWYDMSKQGKQQALKAAFEVFTSIAQNKDEINQPQLKAGAWKEAYEAAEKYNQPGVFTTLHGFEWTSVPGGNNLHRTLIFRDNVDRVSQVVPFSAFDSQDPAELWKFMDKYEKSTGGQVLAIPHNSNLSNGLMFTAETYDHKPMDRAYAEARSGHEPLMEATQVKGDSETHPFLSPNDEFADFERYWAAGNLGNPPTPKVNSMLQYEYARSALKLGLLLESKLGANPYNFGMVGASDEHTGVFTMREENFFGQFTESEPAPDRWQNVLLKFADGKPAYSVWMEQAAGLGGVWARENTREAIWDALKRKEAYATTGDRPIVRVFAGWDFVPADNNRPDFAAHGYAGGVPMGGNLSKAPTGKSPVFMVHGVRDPDGPNLDRIQIIKGWLGKDGKTYERIYDVAVSGGRKIGPDGTCKILVGSTVDVANATYSNSIGAAFLSAYWKDPHFNAAELAFYYVRVIQIPSPRWTAYDQKRFGIKMAAYVPMTVTDRAYTSPIWYKP